MCTGILFVNQIKCDSGIFYLLTKTRIFANDAGGTDPGQAEGE